MEREEEEEKRFSKNEIEYHGGELEQIEINVLSPLTPNTPLIHTWFTYSIWNMGEICGLKFHLIYVHTSQNFLLKSLHAQNVSFLLLILHF